MSSSSSRKSHKSHSHNPKSEGERRDQRWIAHVSEKFVSPYFSAMDSPNRLKIIPSLYLPNSTLSWNGNPLQGSQINQMLETLPESKHEVQVFDCQILGRDNQGLVSSILLTLTGLVTHSTPCSILNLPISNAPSSNASTSKRKLDPSSGQDPDIPLTALGRQFNQVFMLVNLPSEAEGGININFEGRDGRWWIRNDCFRFVG